MTVAGEGRAPGRSHLLQLAGPAGISNRDAQALLEKVAAAAARWRTHARQAGVGTRTAKMIGNAIEECLARL
ncbi:MAG: hypothetical protein ACLGI9_12245, partial [Thermoanaerobaculia bacterium]